MCLGQIASGRGLDRPETEDQGWEHFLRRQEFMPLMKPRQGSSLAPIVAGFLVFSVLSLWIRSFSAREKEAPARVPVYLDSAEGVLAKRRRLGAGVQEATQEKIEEARSRGPSRGLFGSRASRSSFSAFSRVFASKPTVWSSPEFDPSARTLAESEVLYRLLGLPEGDFLYHRDRGWLRLVEGEWVEVEDQDLPEAVALYYPRLVRRDYDSRTQRGTGSPRARGTQDGVFAVPAWLLPDSEKESGGESE